MTTWRVTNRKGRILYWGPDRRLAVYHASKHKGVVFEKIQNGKPKVLFSDV